VELNLDRALKEIENNKYFKVLERENLTKVSYRYNAPFVFDSPLKRELRGITFDRKTGSVVSRPFHKFFNLNEVEETKEEKLRGKYIFREKLDGTMLHPVLINNKVKLLTQKGFSNPYTEKGEELLKKNDNLLNFTKELLNKGFTPIFELISPEFQLVIPYDKDELFLTEIRENKTGRYYLEKWENEIKERGIKIPRKFYGKLKDLLNLMENRENVEGFVLKDFSKKEPFPLFVKVKSPWYVEHHYAFTYLNNIPDYKLFNLFLQEKIDDIFSRVTNKNLVREKEERLKKLTNLYTDLLSLVEKLSEVYGSSKFDEVFEREIKKLKKKYRRDFSKLKFQEKYLKEAVRIAKTGGKYESYLGTKFYTMLKTKEIELLK
jgi:hypothetical protein